VRIWLQSNTSIGYDPKWQPYLAAEEAHLDTVKSPGTEIRIAGVPAMEADLEYSAYKRYLNTRQVIDLALEAERDGYDAFAMIGMGLAGKAEITELLSIPVIYSETAAWWVGSWLHGRFGLLGHNAAVYRRRVEQITQAGLADRFVLGDHADLTLETVLAGFADPTSLVERMTSTSERAARDGAAILIPDFNPLSAVLSNAGVRAFHGVPVMDVSGVTLRVAEMLAAGRDIAGLGGAR
jgi:Asp/Glu/hydantoin racemase